MAILFPFEYSFPFLPSLEWRSLENCKLRGQHLFDEKIRHYKLQWFVICYCRKGGFIQARGVQVFLCNKASRFRWASSSPQNASLNNLELGSRKSWSPTEHNDSFSFINEFISLSSKWVFALEYLEYSQQFHQIQSSAEFVADQRFLKWLQTWDSIWFCSIYFSYLLLRIKMLLFSSSFSIISSVKLSEYTFWKCNQSCHLFPKFLSFSCFIFFTLRNGFFFHFRIIVLCGLFVLHTWKLQGSLRWHEDLVFNCQDGKIDWFGKVGQGSGVVWVLGKIINKRVKVLWVSVSWFPWVL